MLDIRLKKAIIDIVINKHRRKNMIIRTGNDIKKFRELNNMSQYKLAKAINVTRNRLAYYEYAWKTRLLPMDIAAKFYLSKKLDTCIPVYAPVKKLKLWERIMNFILLR